MGSVGGPERSTTNTSRPSRVQLSARTWYVTQLQRALRVLCVCGIVGCAAEVPVIERTPHSLIADTLASADDGAFFRPADIVLLPSGELAVLEYTPSAIVVIDSSSGARVRRIGGPGKGPGELEQPLGLRLSGDTLVTLNAGNGRVERFLVDGTVLESRPAPIGAHLGRFAFNPDGGMLLPTAGADSTLLRVLAPNGTLSHRTGRPRVPFTRQYNLDAFRAQAERLEVPDYYGNDVLAAMSPDSVFWLAFGAIPEVAAYHRDGSVVATFRLPDSLSTPILEDYRTRNREAAGTLRFHQLSFFADIRFDDALVWVLLRNPPDLDARVLVLDQLGALKGNYVIAGAKDVWRIAPARRAGWLYLSSATTSEVYRVALPDSLRR
ncbi:hypothetical protein Strain138_001161 [Pseudogemmatithrix spongiicola]|uniref:6-bladed beta-propeller n=1 Tax=Pseudogemmatithrix spongiicola TaxID=3062599 RepID=A0AA49Q4H3_9BACT|nr:hypothetical protein Strain138_001161 [Gemmatimonadaceae bacterium 'strain 138']WKW14803.1 hypothetical protein Strain318_001161 [Gemmatimonadaceae bacterium 'strain 318']